MNEIFELLVSAIIIIKRNIIYIYIYILCLLTYKYQLIYIYLFFIPHTAISSK